MGSPSASSGSADAPMTTRSKVSTATKTKIAVKNAITNFEPLPVKIFKAFSEGAKKSKQNVLDYEGQAAGVTPMRSPITTGRDGGNGGGQSNVGAATSSGVVVQSPTVTAPTTAEVSQSTSTEAEDPILLRRRRTLARGRSPTIMTGVTGATGSLTLGKPSLLGR